MRESESTFIDFSYMIGAAALSSIFLQTIGIVAHEPNLAPDVLCPGPSSSLGWKDIPRISWVGELSYSYEVMRVCPMSSIAEHSFLPVASPMRRDDDCPRTWWETTTFN